MASTQSTETTSDSRSIASRLGFILSEYRPIVYGVVGILTLWMLGYGLDLLAEFTGSAKLLNTIGGLLGASAMVITICGAVVTLLWGGLVLSNRRRS